MKATVFSIQRNSLVDGPGIRTTVFFKGCSLKCKWCHNPEGISAKGQILFYPSRCTGCKKCTLVCPNSEKECTLCGNCAIFCPTDARELCGREYGVQELFEILSMQSCRSSS